MGSTSIRALSALLLVVTSCSSDSKKPADASVRQPDGAAEDLGTAKNEEPLLELKSATFADLNGWADDDHLAAAGSAPTIMSRTGKEEGR